MAHINEADESPLNHEIDDVSYWYDRTAEERLQHLEYLRRKVYFEEQAKIGNHPTEMPRMQKVIRIIRGKDKNQEDD